MFKINRRTDYAVRVLLCLAKMKPGTRLPTAHIMQEMLIPKAYLQRIIADLAREGLIATYAGPNGGIELSRPAEVITLRDVWEAIEGEMLISDCLKAPGECPLDESCPVRSRWGRLQAMLLHELEAITMAELASDAAENLMVDIKIREEELSHSQFAD